jgi:Domain of unknown function (DUF4349)
MSLPDLDERFDELVLELRATQVSAPAELRDRVQALAAAQPDEQSAKRRRRLPLRRLALVAVPAAVILAAAGALVGGFLTSGGGKRPTSETALRAFGAKAAQAPARSAPPGSLHAASGGSPGAGATLVPSRGRAQLYTADIYLRVKNLSTATKSALATTRSLGGYVRSVNYDDGKDSGSAELVVRVPLRAVQTAIVRFSALGTILQQHVNTQDVQPQLDARFRQMQALRLQISKLQKLPVTDSTTAKIGKLQRELRALQAEQAREVKEYSFATIALQLTSKQPVKPKPQPVPPSRIDRTLDRAGAILLDEAVVVLYVLIVGGPIALLAGFFIAGGRAVRRRGEARLLERS